MWEWTTIAITVIDPHQPSQHPGRDSPDLQPEDFDANRVAGEPANRGATEDSIYVYSGSEHNERPHSCSPGPSSRTRSNKTALSRSQSIQTRATTRCHQGSVKPHEAASNESLGKDNPTRSKEEPIMEESDDDEASAKQITIIIEELSDRLRDYRAHGTTLMGVCDSMYAMTRRRRSPEVLLRRVRAKGEREHIPVRFYPPPTKYLTRGASDSEPE